jgi:uncharacterized membrane protein
MAEYSQEEVADLTFQFPKAFQQAQVDWAKIKLGLKYSLFSDPTVLSQALDFYHDFAKLWEIVRPNFFVTPQGNPAPDHAVKYAKTVDAWIATMNRDRLESGLGIAPLIIAGILIAGAFGVAGAVWAVGYLKKQANISALISGVVDGKVPVEVLETAIKQEQTIGTFGGLLDLFKWGAVVLGLYLVVPVIKDVVKKK